MKIYSLSRVLDENAVTLRGVILISCVSYFLGSYRSHRWHMKTLKAIRQKLAEEDSSRVANDDASNSDSGGSDDNREQDNSYDG